MDSLPHSKHFGPSAVPWATPLWILKNYNTFNFHCLGTVGQEINQPVFDLWVDGCFLDIYADGSRNEELSPYFN